jgi:aminopeptidase
MRERGDWAKWLLARIMILPRFSRNILFDEKIGGTVHLALGAGYPETGSQNVSALHWDMICDMRQGEAYADGRLIYKDGKFLI